MATITLTATMVITSDPAGQNTLAESELKKLALKLINEINMSMGGTTLRVTAVELPD